MTEKGRSPEASARRKAKRDAKAPAPPQGTQNDKFPAAAPPHSASTLERTASANCDHRQEREISAGIPQGTQTAREFGDEDFQQAREWVLARYPDFERNADVANKLTFYLMAVYASSRVASLQQELKYAHLAIGGNPSIQLDDKIRALREIARELAKSSRNVLDNLASDWHSPSLWNIAELQAALDKFSDREKGGGR